MGLRNLDYTAAFNNQINHIANEQNLDSKACLFNYVIDNQIVVLYII